jgi:LPS export ABC transporter protein LptC/lipopolysaccharide transport protein LptA
MRPLALVLGFLFMSRFLAFAEEQTQQFEGFALDGYTNNGEKSWDIKGDTAQILGNNISLTNIDANSYGKEQVNLKAERGTLDNASGSMHLKNDVVITTETGAQLKTDELDWQRQKDLVTTDKKVTLTRDEVIAEALGAIAHPNLQTAQMNEDVTVKLTPEPGKPGSQQVTITCDGPLEVDQLKQVAVFNNNVVAIQEDREVRADRMELYFDMATSQIKEMVCIGNVSIKQAGNTTYSERATYRAGEQRMTLSGRPKLILNLQGGDQFAPLGN